MNLDRLERRSRRIRSVADVRRWEYRQRHHAKGVWFRVRRVLADARACWEVSGETAEALQSEGWQPERAGLELAPPRRMIFLPEDRIEAIAERRPLRVGLTSELLAAPVVVMVRFASSAEPAGRREP